MCYQQSNPGSPTQAMTAAQRAEAGTAQEQYNLNAAYSPMYTALNLSNLDSFLGGTNGQPGFLSEYQNQIMPALTSAQIGANTATRTANLNDAANLTPQYIAEERAANPGAAGLLDTMSSNATRDLSYGTQLTPAEQVQMNQSVRGASAARGMGFGPSDVFNESLADTGFGQQLYQQRMGEAGSTAQELQGFYGNPTAAISGMDSQAGLNASSLLGFGMNEVAPGQSGEFNADNNLAGSYMTEQAAGGAEMADQQNAGLTSAISSGSGLLSSL